MSDYLPDSLLLEILYRLPIQSLLRFICVSKQWGSLITSPHFILTHSHSSSLLLLRHLSTRPKNQEKYSVYLDTQNLTLLQELRFPFKSINGNNFRVVGFCNGVFCLSDDLFGYTYTLILWNPAIRRSISLPKPRVHFDKYGPYMFCLGFGFDKRSSDMKVVRISYVQDNHGAYTVMPPEVEVYSVSSGVWRTVDSKEIKCRIVEHFYNSVCLSGVIHWLSFIRNGVESFSNSLLVFDLGDERFSEMGLPERLANVSPLDLSLTLCGDQISVIWYKRGRHQGGYFVVWVMKQYGKIESWTKEFVVFLKNEIYHSVGFMGNREFLVEKSGGHLMLYDPVRKEFKDLGILGGKDSFFSCEYVESLMLLDGNSEATTDFEEANDADPQISYEQTETKLWKEWSWNILCAKASLFD